MADNKTRIKTLEYKQSETHSLPSIQLPGLFPEVKDSRRINLTIDTSAAEIRNCFPLCAIMEWCLGKGPTLQQINLDFNKSIIDTQKGEDM
jgi:hypothetical protein